MASGIHSFRLWQENKILKIGENNMNNRTIKIFFKDNTNTTFEDGSIWTSQMIVDDIKRAMALKIPYIFSSHNQNDCGDILIIPTENIRYIRIIDKPSDSDEKA